jgi:type II secretory pathway component PulM
VTARDRIVLIVVAAAAVLGGFYMLLLKPKREEASQLTQQVATAEQRVQAARAQLAAGQQARATYAVNYATVARLGKAVPTDDDVPSLVYQLDSTAEATGVDFRSVKLSAGATSPATAASQSSGAAAAATSDQSGGEKSAAEKANGEPSGQSGSAGAAPAPTGTTTSPAAPTQAATAALPPGAVVGPAGLNTMPFTFSFEGDFFRLSDFLTRLERYIKPQGSAVDVRGRLLLVDGIALNAAGSGFPAMKASIAATAYLLPASQGLFDGATPEGPSVATPTQPVSDGSAAPTAPATVTP